jgi:hypothetical protein
MPIGKDPPPKVLTLTQLYMKLISMIALLMAAAFLAFVMLYREINIFTCFWAAITIILIASWSIADTGLLKIIRELKTRNSINGTG